MREDKFKIDIPKHWLRRAVIAVAVGMLVLPVAAWASDRFEDVPDSNIFHDDIQWLAEEGVTRGCNPPENSEFCPDDNVTREQMAAFLHRMDTEDVFVTPEEADAAVSFAVVAADGSTSASNGVDEESTTRDSLGTYDVAFTTDISNCSWTGAVGDRTGTHVPNATVTLNAGASNDTIRALVTDGTGTLIDEDFNVTVNC